MDTSTKTQYIIYAGGTFGCHGTPLSVLPQEQFLPTFQDCLTTTAQRFVFLDNDVIKDSSTLTPEDFLHFYTLIKNAHKTQQATQFLLITGTDTLSFLSAFLTIGLSHLPIQLIITGSMLPLFHANISPLTIDEQSDAWDNLSTALAFARTNTQGVYVSFNQQILLGDSTQKIHTSSKNAFVGQALTEATYRQYPQFTPIADGLTYSQIHALYCLPNHANHWADSLTLLLTQPPSAIILIGFGAGNMPTSDKLKNTLKQLIDKHFLIIMTSGCPFGAVDATYATGAWQYTLGVVSGTDTPLPTLYAKALWLCLALPSQERRPTWQKLWGEK